MFSLPDVNFNTLMSKWSFAVYIFIRFMFQSLVLTGAGILISIGSMFLNGALSLNPATLFISVFGNPFFQIILLGLLFANGRTVLFRMDDKEVQ